MLRVLGICRPVNGFLKVGDMISLLRRFPRFCRPSVFFSGHTEPSLIPWAIQQRTEALFAIVGAAAADRVICYTDAGKTPTRFSFFDNLGTVSTSFLYFLLAVLPECCFSVPLWNLTTASPSSYPIRTVIQFSRYTGKISPIYRQREGPFVDPLLEKFFKVRKSPLFWQIQRRKFVLYLFSHPSACQLHYLCEQIFL